METVLVTAIGSFSADIVIKTLKKLGKRVIGCDIYPGEWIVDSMQVDAFYQVPYASAEETYVDSVLSICRRENVSGLLVLTDVEVDVWNRWREALAEQSVILCLSSERTLELCRDKRKMCRFLMEKGLGNPIPTMGLADTVLEDLTYPVVIKPYNGRSSQGLHYFHSEKEMGWFLDHCNPEEYIVQPCHKGSIITADVVRQAQTGACVVICRKELLRTPNGAGTSVLIFSDSELEVLCRDMAHALKINGCVNFEFIQDEEGIYHLLECNPRFSGGVEFSCMAGYDCIANHLRCFTGEDIEVSEKITQMYISRKYEEHITKIVTEEKDEK